MQDGLDGCRPGASLRANAGQKKGELKAGEGLAFATLYIDRGALH